MFTILVLLNTINICCFGIVSVKLSLVFMWDDVIMMKSELDPAVQSPNGQSFTLVLHYDVHKWCLIDFCRANFRPTK